MGECIVGGLSSTEIIAGTYTGDGAATRTINLGFTPKWVLVINATGIFDSAGSTVYSGLAVSGNSATGPVTITNGGFVVIANQSIDSYGTKAWTNMQDKVYNYIAGK